MHKTLKYFLDIPAVCVGWRLMEDAPADPFLIPLVSLLSPMRLTFYLHRVTPTKENEGMYSL